MRTTKEQLRRIVRETINRKIECLDENMIITKQGLQQLIDEEFSQAISARQKGLNEVHRRGRGGRDMYEMDSWYLLEFARSYTELGRAVQDQLHDIMDNADNGDVNPNAVDLMEEKLSGFNEEIDDALTAYRDYMDGPSDWPHTEED